MSLFASRYAQAFADVVSEAKLDPAEVARQLEDFAATFAGSADLRQLLSDPALPVEIRVAALDAVNRRVGCSRQVRNFLAVLIRHERISAFLEVLQEYRLEMDRRLKISEAEIITARKLAGKERADLRRQVAELAGSEINASFREDESLIGGVIVRLGSTVYDGSIKGHLDRLRDRLAAD